MTPAEGAADGEQLPRLAVWHESYSFDPVAVAEAARDLCAIVWVVDWLGYPVGYPVRFLSRLGTVVEVAGLDAAQIASRLADLGTEGMIAFTDRPIRLAAEVAERLELPFHSPAVARGLSDKLVQREALRAAGLPVPRFSALQPSQVTSERQATQLPVGWPAVLKPRRAEGSRDAYLVSDPSQLLADLRSCADEGFILEEFLLGRRREQDGVAADMVSVETIVDGPVTHHVATTGRFRLAPPFRETGSFMPSDLDGVDATSAVAQAADAAKALGVARGVMHTEFKLTPDGPRIIEVNGRVGGGIPGLLTRLGATPILRGAMRLALSLEVNDVRPLQSTPVAFFYWAPAALTTGRLKAVEGLERVGQLPGVDRVTVNQQIGDELDPRLGIESRVVTVDGSVPAHADLWRLIEEIKSTLSISFA